MAEIVETSSDAPSQTVTLATVFKFKDLGDGQFELTEVPSDEFSPPDFHSGNRKTFDYALPIPTAKVVGYVDFDDQEIGVYFTLAGSQVGPQLKASLNSGFSYNLNLGIGSGSVRIFKDGNAIKLSYNLKVGFGIFSKSYSDTVTLFTF